MAIRYSFDLEGFVDCYLSGDMHALAGLSIKRVFAAPEQFGGMGLGSPDCDETDLVWEVYNRLWDLERMPESPPLMPGMVLSQYRGDTMNSFNTLFGRPIYEDPIRICDGDGVVGFAGLRKNGVEDELFDKVYKFWYDYHTIGNFIPMPNAKFRARTMNTFRTKWHDYFDRFLGALRLELAGYACDLDEPFTSLVGVNDFFWNRYYGEEGWRAYIEEFCLQDYCDEDFVPKSLYEGVWYWKKGLSRDEYVKACNEYINTATRLILARGQRMISKLIAKAV